MDDPTCKFQLSLDGPAVAARLSLRPERPEAQALEFLLSSEHPGRASTRVKRSSAFGHGVIQVRPIASRPHLPDPFTPTHDTVTAAPGLLDNCAL
eukprot:582238-Hanusia_phi.AAC.2